MTLSDNVSKAGSCKVKSLCAEPGVAATDLADNLEKGHKAVAGGNDAAVPVVSFESVYPGVQSAADGACPLMEAAFGADAESGDFYMPGERVKGTPVGMPVRCMTAGVPTPSTEFIAKRFQHEKLTMDERNRDVLWRASEAAVGRWELGSRVHATTTAQSKL